MNAERYDNPPISEKTRQGMTLTIDDRAAIGRLLSLQDDVYEEALEKINKRLSSIERKQENIMRIVKNHERRIQILEKTVEELAS